METLQRLKSIQEVGVKDLLITRQNATTTAANLLIKFGGDFSNDTELVNRLTRIADKLVAYHWEGVQRP